MNHETGYPQPLAHLPPPLQGLLSLPVSITDAGMVNLKSHGTQSVSPVSIRVNHGQQWLFPLFGMSGKGPRRLLRVTSVHYCSSRGFTTVSNSNTRGSDISGP